MDLTGALNSLVNTLKGSGGAENTSSSGGTTATDGCASGGGAAEVAIGNQLANINNEAESAKSIEEKANTALEDLMDKLGINGSEADSEKNEIKGALLKDKIEEQEEINKKLSEEEIKEIKENVEEMIVKFPEGEERPSLVDKIKDYFEMFSNEGLTMKEAKTYLDGEKEIQRQIATEKLKNRDNPDFDAEACEAEVREAYEKENPEYAAAAEEAKAVEAEFKEAMSNEYDSYCEKYPQPSIENYDNPQDYAKALDRWTDKMNEHLEKAEQKYKEENKDYRVLSHMKEADELNGIIGSGGIIQKDPGVIWSGGKPISIDGDLPIIGKDIDIDISALKNYKSVLLEKNFDPNKKILE